MQRRWSGLRTGLFLLALVLAACSTGRNQAPPQPSVPVHPEIVRVALNRDVVVSPAQPVAISTPDPLNGFTELPVVPYVKSAAASPAASSEPSLTLKLEEVDDRKPLQIPLQSEVERLSEAAAAELLAQVPQLAGRTSPAPLELPVPLARLDPPRSGGIEIHEFRPLADDVPELTHREKLADLKVVRFFPSGPVDWVPRINIVFSKPMIPLSSHAALAAYVPAMNLSPQLSGEWQWLGTQSLMFQPGGPLASATRYQITVPPGIEALDGSALKSRFVGSFETPRLQLTRTWPPADRPLHLQPHFALEFNQAIDPQELVSSLKLESATSDPIAIDVLSKDSVSLPLGLQGFLSRSVPERTIVLQPSELLASNARITLTVGRGAPSAEGPLLTQIEQQATWKTFGPLQTTSIGCSWNQCNPGDAYVIYFNHDLDTESLVDGMVRIKPALPDGKVHITPWGIRVTGSTAPNTTYALRIEPGLTDVFGQTLSTVQELVFHVQPDPTPGKLHLPRVMEVLHPADGGQYSLFTRNLDELRVLLFQVEPSDWPQYVAARDDSGRWGSWLGMQDSIQVVMLSESSPVTLLSREPVLDTLLSVENSPDETIETVLDLNPYLDGGRGHLLLVVMLPEDVKEYSFCGYYREKPVGVAAWIQVTDMGLDGYTDGRSLLTRAVDLTSGDPLANLKVQFQSHDIHTHDIHTNTDTEGYVLFDWSALEDWRSTLIVEQPGRDAALLPFEFYSKQMHVEHRWHLFSDRYLYRPGEEVQIKGWVRQVGFSPVGDVSWARSDLDMVHYRVYDGRGVQLDQGITELDPHGALDFRFRVPADANSGLGTVDLSQSELGGNEDTSSFSTNMHFRIEEFRRPEFAVTLAVGEGHHMLQDPVQFEAQAGYYGGGALENASVTWKVSGRPARYKPPGWQHFEFGVAVPWWRDGWARADDIPMGTLSAETDVQGRHQVAVTAVSEVQMPVAHVLQVEAIVQDLSQRH